MSQVLITGGTGFIGSWVIRKLVEQGAGVVTYSRRPDTTFLKDIEGKFDCVAGDVMDLPSLLRTIKDYQVERVIHMVTLLVKALETNPFLGYRVNVDGALNVFEACRLMDVKRVVYISSKAVYDELRGEHAPPTNKPIDEDYPKGPRSVYGATKLFMENMGLSYHRIYGLDFVALRFAATYGPGKQARHTIGAPSINTIIESGIIRRPLKVAYDMDRADDMIYVKDIANGIVQACFAQKLEHRIFHLGTGKGETLRHVAEIVKKVLNGAPIEIGPDAGGSAGRNPSIMNIERARRELGYSPEYDLEAGIRDHIETMKRMGIEPAELA